ncbi:GntR family transcriptional regulator [Enterococcus sp. PF1-24]|uniref:GntR family transcriptional regulator n=1 Tax=unclassified Enterococcus TaxID=2608891 RepID=UPI002472EB2A|nr:MULTISPECIES: GntR family transcriptional regulator [unclassified Enterococcus]MDH6365486.1 GntR family transcriptional regulator [Enterococcus sp. PFB1-1]MDH6402587.1 GntR family transcriptional regulator [Enterococcus sp. PF1-24]
MILEISNYSEVPIYKQLRDQIILGIAKGELAAGEQLPSVRLLADEIGVNTMTISKAYNLLKEEGYLLTDRRLGTKVATFEPAKTAYPQKLADQLALILAESSIQRYSETDILAEVTNILTQFRKDDLK